MARYHWYTLSLQPVLVDIHIVTGLFPNRMVC